MEKVGLQISIEADASQIKKNLNEAMSNAVQLHTPELKINVNSDQVVDAFKNIVLHAEKVKKTTQEALDPLVNSRAKIVSEIEKIQKEVAKNWAKSLLADPHYKAMVDGGMAKASVSNLIKKDIGFAFGKTPGDASAQTLQRSEVDRLVNSIVKLEKVTEDGAKQAKAYAASTSKMRQEIHLLGGDIKELQGHYNNLSNSQVQATRGLKTVANEFAKMTDGIVTTGTRMSIGLAKELGQAATHFDNSLKAMSKSAKNNKLIDVEGAKKDLVDLQAVMVKVRKMIDDGGVNPGQVAHAGRVLAKAGGIVDRADTVTLPGFVQQNQNVMQNVAKKSMQTNVWDKIIKYNQTFDNAQSSMANGQVSDVNLRQLAGILGAMRKEENRLGTKYVSYKSAGNDDAAQEVQRLIAAVESQRHSHRKTYSSIAGRIGGFNDSIAGDAMTSQATTALQRMGARKGAFATGNLALASGRMLTADELSGLGNFDAELGKSEKALTRKLTNKSANEAELAEVKSTLAKVRQIRESHALDMEKIAIKQAAVEADIQRKADSATVKEAKQTAQQIKDAKRAGYAGYVSHLAQNEHIIGGMSRAEAKDAVHRLRGARSALSGDADAVEIISRLNSQVGARSKEIDRPGFMQSLLGSMGIRMPGGGDGPDGPKNPYGNQRNGLFNRVNHNITNVSQMMGTSLYGLGAIGLGSAVVGGTIKKAAELDTMKLTLAGIVNSYTQFTNAQGKSVTNAENLNRSLAYSGTLYEKLRTAAKKSGLLTPAELAEGFATGGPSLKKRGFSDDQTIEVTKNIMLLGRAMGLTATAVLSDVRDFGAGRVNARSQVLTAAGLDAKELKGAFDTGGSEKAFKYFQEKFKSFDETFTLIAGTPAGKLNAFKIELEQTAQTIGATLAPIIIPQLEKFRQTIEEWVKSGQAARFATSLGNLLNGLADVFNNFVKYMGPIVSNVNTLLLVTLAGVFVAFGARMLIMSVAMSNPITALLAGIGILITGIIQYSRDAELAANKNEAAYNSIGTNSADKVIGREKARQHVVELLNSGEFDNPQSYAYDPDKPPLALAAKVRKVLDEKKIGEGARGWGPALDTLVGAVKHTNERSPLDITMSALKNVDGYFRGFFNAISVAKKETGWQEKSLFEGLRDTGMDAAQMKKALNEYANARETDAYAGTKGAKLIEEKYRFIGGGTRQWDKLVKEQRRKLALNVVAGYTGVKFGSGKGTGALTYFKNNPKQNPYDSLQDKDKRIVDAAVAGMVESEGQTAKTESTTTETPKLVKIPSGALGVKQMTLQDIQKAYATMLLSRTTDQLSATSDDSTDARGNYVKPGLLLQGLTGGVGKAVATWKDSIWDNREKGPLAISEANINLVRSLEQLRASFVESVRQVQQNIASQKEQNLVLQENISLQKQANELSSAKFGLSQIRPTGIDGGAAYLTQAGRVADMQRTMDVASSSNNYRRNVDATALQTHLKYMSGSGIIGTLSPEQQAIYKKAMGGDIGALNSLPEGLLNANQQAAVSAIQAAKMVENASKIKASAERGIVAKGGSITRTSETDIIQEMGAYIKTPKGQASCAFFASQLLSETGVSVVKTGGAKGLIDKITAGGGMRIPSSEALPGDLIYYHGPDKGAKDNRNFIENGVKGGYHVGVYAGGGVVVDSSGGKIRLENSVHKGAKFIRPNRTKGTGGSTNSYVLDKRTYTPGSNSGETDFTNAVMGVNPVTGLADNIVGYYENGMPVFESDRLKLNKRTGSEVKAGADESSRQAYETAMQSAFGISIQDSLQNSNFAVGQKISLIGLTGTALSDRIRLNGSDKNMREAEIAATKYQDDRAKGFVNAQMQNDIFGESSTEEFNKKYISDTTSGVEAIMLNARTASAMLVDSIKNEQAVKDALTDVSKKMMDNFQRLADINFNNFVSFMQNPYAVPQSVSNPLANRLELGQKDLDNKLADADMKTSSMIARDKMFGTYDKNIESDPLYYDKLSNDNRNKARGVWQNQMSQVDTSKLQLQGATNNSAMNLLGALGPDLFGFATGKKNFGTTLMGAFSPLTEVFNAKQNYFNSMLIGATTGTLNISKESKDPMFNKIFGDNPTKESIKMLSLKKVGNNLLNNFAGNAVGSALFHNKDPEAISLGTQLGAAFGFWGAIAGGVLGGLFGGRKHSPEEERFKQATKDHFSQIEKLTSETNRLLRPSYDVFNTIRGEVLYGSSQRWFSGRAYSGLAMQSNAGAR